MSETLNVKSAAAVAGAAFGGASLKRVVGRRDLVELVGEAMQDVSLSPNPKLSGGERLTMANENTVSAEGTAQSRSMKRLVNQQRGFWRSPGGEWAHEGDIHDTDRLRWLVDNMTEEIAVMMPDDFGQARQYIDELMLANVPDQRPGANT